MQWMLRTLCRVYREWLSTKFWGWSLQKPNSLKLMSSDSLDVMKLIFFFYEGNETGLDVMQRTTFENHQSSVYVYVSIPFLRASPFIRWWIYAKQMLIIFQIFERNTSHVLQFPLLSLCVHILIAIQNWTGCEINSSKMSVFYSRMNAFARTAIYTQTHPLRMWHSMYINAKSICNQYIECAISTNSSRSPASMHVSKLKFFFSKEIETSRKYQNSFEMVFTQRSRSHLYSTKRISRSIFRSKYYFHFSSRLVLWHISKF